MFKSPFSLKGRIRRLEYGLSLLMYLFFYLMTIFMLEVSVGFGIIFFILLILSFIVILTQGTKRCHDLGHAGYYQFIPFYTLWLLFQEGDEKENSYGLNPKENHFQKTNEAKDINPKYILIGSLLLLGLLVFAGIKYTPSFEDKPLIQWSKSPLVWEDFELVSFMEEDYVALIHSNISCPKIITDKESRVYAYMDPNESERLREEYDGYNVLTHEQYHFNITEYCARLLRKDIVAKGLGGLSFKTMKELYQKNYEKLEILQNQYDSITDHNADYQLQRQWELKIDDWLRQTAYYENDDINSYADFAKNPTPFFKHIYFSFSDEVLTSYRVKEKDIKQGETYEIEYVDYKERIVKFYKDGKLTNGGYFETAIAKISKPEKGFSEVHYYNHDESYNTELQASIIKSEIDENKNKTDEYYNADNERIAKGVVFETHWKFNVEKDSYYTSYFNKSGKLVAYKDGIFHKKYKLDKKQRFVLFANFDRKHAPKNNGDLVARYEIAFSDTHKKTSYRMYDENGEFAFHLNDYNLAYTHDERGNISSVTSLDANNEITYDYNGAAIYEYTYDLFDRETSVKRFNKAHEPIVANDDYFLQIKQYDSIGRINNEGNYYPGYALRYSDDLWGGTNYSYEGDSIVKQYNIDVYKDPILDKTNVSIIKKRINKKKEIIERIYLDTIGASALTNDGVVSYRYTYDSNGNGIKTSAHDAFGQLIAFDGEVAIIRRKFDANNNKTATTYYNSQDVLSYDTDSITHNIYKYNKTNQVVEIANYTIEMQPAAVNKVFKTEIQVNKSGLDSVQLDYTINGKLLKGACIRKYEYNKFGNKTRTTHYNAAQKRVKNENGISAIRILYNKRQKVIGYEYLDANDRYTNTNEGIAIKKWTLDEVGHQTTYAFFDKNKKPVIGPYGYHKIEYQWGAMGEISKSTIYDQTLALTEDESGTAIYEYKLLPSGLYSEVKRYNKEQKLADNNKGVAITKYLQSLDGLYYLDLELNALHEVVKDTISE